MTHLVCFFSIVKYMPLRVVILVIPIIRVRRDSVFELYVDGKKTD